MESSFNEPSPIQSGSTAGQVRAQVSKGWRGRLPAHKERFNRELRTLLGTFAGLTLSVLCTLAVQAQPAPPPPERSFIRGDCRADDEVNITDAVYLLNCLFLGGECSPCQDACDANDDGGVDVSDAIYILSYLFLGGRTPPPPFPNCGADPTEDDLRCEETSENCADIGSREDTVLLHSRKFVPEAGISNEDLNEILESELPRVHVLVQTEGTLNNGDVEELTRLGLHRVFHIPHRAWLASVPRDIGSVDAIVSHPAVRSIVALAPEDRIAQNIRSDGIDARLIEPLDGTAFLELRIYDDVPLNEASGLIAGIVEQIVAQSDFLHALLVRVDPLALDTLAQLDPIALIAEVPPPPKDDNDQIRINTNASLVQVMEDIVAGGAVVSFRPGRPYGLGGNRVRIGQWEPLRPDSCHPDFQGILRGDGTIAGTQLRVTFGADADGVPDADCDDPGYSATADNTIGDHATHVAGIVLGNGGQSAAVGGLPWQWRGMAPNAEIIAYLAPGLDTSVPPDGLADAGPVTGHAAQYILAKAAGIELSVNSWGYSHCHQVGTASCYDLGAENYDKLILDYGNAARDKTISIFGSAGNRGPGDPAGTPWGGTRLPNSAKNTIVVGSITSDTNVLTPTSSRGPVDDGRIKPDLIAPGEQSGVPDVNSTVMTTRTDTVPPGSGCNSNGTPDDGTDDCAFPYDEIGGTSMATPAATGAAALLVEQFRTRGRDPWPSTVKALMIHTARDQCCTDAAGNDVDTPGPDYAYGYGAIDVQAALDLLRDDRNANVVEAAGFSGSGSCPQDPAVSCGTDDAYFVTIPPGVANYRVTLVYDDLPAAPGMLARGAPALRNDLDLFLVAPDGTVSQPWILNPAPGARGTAATRGRDSLNPVEVVDVQNPDEGLWMIVVRPVVLQPSDADEEASAAQRYTLIYETFRPDVMIRDYPEDDGGVPSVRIVDSAWSPARFWHSPDIQIEGSESIEPGVERILHVVITNAGDTMIDGALVQLYWAEAGVGLDFSDFAANPMGHCAMPVLPPGRRSDSLDCTIPYTWDPSEVTIGADGKAHVCLLATVTATGDGITFPGFTTVEDAGDLNPPRDYVPWDNNLAQENLHEEFTGDDDAVFDVDIHNPSEEAQTAIEVVIDRRGLPHGWAAEIEDGPVFGLNPGEKADTRLRISPPPSAPKGAVGTVALHGVDLLTGHLVGGSTFRVVVGSRP